MPDSRPYQILTVALQAASVALVDTRRGSPGRALIVDSDPDWDNCCGEDMKGRLAVWGENILPISPGQTKCATVYGLNVVVQLLRCADSTTDDQWQAMTRDLWEDTWALMDVVCALQTAGWDVTVQNAGPLPEDGGCIATELRMRVTIRRPRSRP